MEASIILLVLQAFAESVGPRDKSVGRRDNYYAEISEIPCSGRAALFARFLAAGNYSSSRMCI